MASGLAGERRKKARPRQVLRPGPYTTGPSQEGSRWQHGRPTPCRVSTTTRKRRKLPRCRARPSRPCCPATSCDPLCAAAARSAAGSAGTRQLLEVMGVTRVDFGRGRAGSSAVPRRYCERARLVTVPGIDLHHRYGCLAGAAVSRRAAQQFWTVSLREGCRCHSSPADEDSGVGGKLHRLTSTRRVIVFRQA